MLHRLSEETVRRVVLGTGSAVIMVNEGVVWLVASVVVGGAFLLFGAAAAIVFYRRNRTHESRTEAYLQKVKAIEEAHRKSVIT